MDMIIGSIFPGYLSDADPISSLDTEVNNSRSEGFWVEGRRPVTGCRELFLWLPGELR